MYLKQNDIFDKRWAAGQGERGGLTIFTAVLVLILMTLLLVYATRVSLFETRVSGNEMRQKEAFHIAEAALDQSVMYLLQNASRVLSSRVDAFPDGSGTTTYDGWFATGATRWLPCPAPAAATHPCGGDVAAVTGSYFYDTDGDGTTRESLPIVTTDFPAGATARMSALLCFVDPANPTAACDTTVPSTPGEERDSTLVLTLLAYGYSDCTDVTNVGSCTGEATVAYPISNFKKLAGSPAVPLVTKSTFPPQGTGEVVANPNGGGLGVPLSAWINENPTCPPATPITSSGTWQTCEMQEWYHVEEYPDGVTCTDNNCLCGPGGNDSDYFLSWKTSTETNIGIDIITDPAFPCDLFEFYFKVPRALYTTIKNQALILSDCTSLGSNSSGLIWISGSECRINGNTSVGSPDNPVILISAASHTFIGGGANIYGVLYIFDGEDSAADLEVLAGATVYGAVINDATLSKYQGTFQIVYADGVLTSATGIAGLGSVNGGWRDFGLPDIGW
ncbi:MAG: PilX N-terminal domain-containing pilus assembly protein [Xanthomonadales bacterium]|nr:PilX N-terminal domain-containing pilus assembly protein [Xanthomonadales bacterium]